MLLHATEYELWYVSPHAVASPNTTTKIKTITRCTIVLPPLRPAEIPPGCQASRAAPNRQVPGRIEAIERDHAEPGNLQEDFLPGILLLFRRSASNFRYSRLAPFPARMAALYPLPRSQIRRAALLCDGGHILPGRASDILPTKPANPRSPPRAPPFLRRIDLSLPDRVIPQICQESVEKTKVMT
jgi:hypothetical protein